MRYCIQCRYCHTEIPGWKSEAVQDAVNSGWQVFPSGAVCGDCLNEQDAQS